MSRSRRHFTPEQKAEVVRRHLSDKVPVSNLAEELKIQPTLIHLWIKHVLDHAATVFERPADNRRADDAKDRRISQLPREARQKNEVVGRADGGACPVKKRTWGTLKGSWVPHDTRDEVVDFVNYWTDPRRVARQTPRTLAGRRTVEVFTTGGSATAKSTSTTR